MLFMCFGLYTAAHKLGLNYSQCFFTGIRVGFLVRSDLLATEIRFNEGSRISVTTASTKSTLKVLSRGNYFLPYVLLEKQSDIAPLRLGDSEGVKLNDNVYMVQDKGAIATGKVTGTTTIKGAPAFLISFLINSSNKGRTDFQPQWRSHRHSSGESRWRRCEFGLFFFSARHTKASG